MRERLFDAWDRFQEEHKVWTGILIGAILTGCFFVVGLVEGAPR